MRKGMWFLLIFNLAYFLPFLIYYALKGNFEFIIYMAVLVLIGLAVFFTLKYTKFDYLVLWGLSIWGLLHLAGGGIPFNNHTLYATHLIAIIDKTLLSSDYFILKMDQVIHFYGFMITAILVFQLLKPYIKNGMSKSRAFLLAWVGSMGFGALNEVIEFLALLFIARTGVGDVYNTGFDLIFNMLGAFIGALIQFYRTKK